MRFDDILVQIGEFGRYQRFVFAPLCLIGIPAALSTLAAVYFNAKVDHWCAVDNWSDDVNSCYDQYRATDTDAYLTCIYTYRNSSIPPILNDDDVYEYSKCEKYDVTFPDSYFPGYSAGKLTNDTTECDEGWVYDRNQYTSSIVTDYDLVCEKKNLPDLAQTIYFFGILVGSFMFGTIADLFGRKIAWFIALAFFTIPGVALAFSPSYWLYTTLRFFIGAGNIGSYLIAFVIATELVGPSYRVLAGIIIQLTFALGYILLTLYAWLIRDWRALQLVIVAHTAVLFFLIPFLPESARWLISTQKFDQAENIIQRAADVNQKQLPEKFMEQIIKTETFGIFGPGPDREISRFSGYLPIGTPPGWEIMDVNPNQRTGTVLDLFKTRNLRFRTLSLMFNWFVVNIVYYGLSLSTSDLGNNDYVTSLISAAMEVLAYLVCIPLMNSFFGRRLSTAFSEILGGLACLSTIFMEFGSWRTSVAMVGKFMISAAFAIIYTFTAEVFPTPLRTIGMGVCSTCSRLGSMLAPIINLLDEIWEPLPLILFGSLSLVAGLLALPLPETRGRTLPETIEEGETFGMKNLDEKTEEDIDDKVVSTIT